MTVKELAQQFQGATLPKLVEKHVKALKLGQLEVAIQEIYLNFPVEFRPAADKFSLSYNQSLMSPEIVSKDLGIVFAQAVEVGEKFAQSQGIDLTDDQKIDLFNLSVMRMAHFAHTRPEFRKMLGIKKGWFS